jgi:hypothetical protein
MHIRKLFTKIFEWRNNIGTTDSSHYLSLKIFLTTVNRIVATMEHDEVTISSLKKVEK